MKKVLSILFVSLFILAAQAQGIKKPVLLINEFAHSHNFSRNEAEAVRNDMITKIQETGRVQVVDKVALSKIKSEGEINAISSDYILSGSLENFTSGCDYNKYSKKNVYNAKLIWTLKLIDPTTGTTINSIQLESSATGDSHEQARHTAISSAARDNVKRFITNFFKVRGSILGEEKVEKEKTKIVVIDRGSSAGVHKGTKFKVYQEIEYYGESSLEELGEIQVDKVVSSSRSICEVKKGHKKIHEHLSLGKKLIIVTTIDNGNIFRL